MKVVAVGREGAGEDVRLVAPEDVAVETGTGRAGGPGAGPRRRRSEGSREIDGRPLVDALEASGFDVAADAHVIPPDEGRRVRGRDKAPMSLRVSVGAGESAVALIEGEGGVFVWVAPDDAGGDGAVRRAGPQQVTFTLDAPARAAPARRGFGDLGLGRLADVLTRRVRILVLRFAVRLTVEAAVSRIEGGNPTGLTTIASLDPETWKPGGVTWRTPPEGRPTRVLLLVHGTFSNTAGSFGHLARHNGGRAFLEGVFATYDAVLGFDHKTLAEDVETNAEGLADALAALPPDSVVDCVAFSRGGLVYRVLADELMPLRRPDVRFGKAIFVGCANGGTHLAHPKNWEALVDLYTNVVMAGARVATLLASGGALDPFVKLGIKTVGEFVQLLSQVAIAERKVPGLASMLPDGPTVARLRKAPRTGETAYFAVTSDFEPTADSAMGLSERLRKFLLDRVTDDLWRGEANDLVVDTASMASFGPLRDVLPLASMHAFGKTGLVYHTVYFASAETCSKMAAWLELSVEVSRQAPPTTAPPILVSTEWDVVVGKGALETFSDEVLKAEAEVRPRQELGRRTRRGKMPEAEGVEDAPIDLKVYAQAPETAPVGREVELEVTLSREVLDRPVGPAYGQAPVAADARRPLRIHVDARHNCEIVGPHEESAPVPRAGTPDVLVFRIKGRQVGQAEVWVSVYQGARRLARIVLQPTFLASATLEATALVSSSDSDPPVVNLRIFEEQTGDRRWRLRFVASSEELGIENEFVTQEIRVDKNKYIADLYAKLEDAWASTEGDFVPLMIQMRAQGLSLYRGLFPEELQEILWRNRDKIGSVQVYSYEPSIPWEVAFLAEIGKAASPGGMFLSELGLTRWISNVGVAPARLRLRPGKALYCIPEYLDDGYNLPSAADEASMLRRKLGATPLDAHLQPVLSALGRSGSEDYDLLHFACHGSGQADNIWNAGLMLAGIKRNGRVAREELRPDDIEAYANLAFDGIKPIIFLNACQTGVGGDTLTGSGGLAQAFVRRGAGAFIGTLWSVGDTTASKFCEVFYDALQSGRTLSQAARAARERAKGDNEATWLAYTVYGHPYARAQTT